MLDLNTAFEDIKFCLVRDKFAYFSIEENNIFSGKQFVFSFPDEKELRIWIDEIASYEMIENTFLFRSKEHIQWKLLQVTFMKEVSFYD